MSSKIPFSGCSLNVFVIVIVLMFVLLIVFCWPDHHCDQMSQRSKVTQIALWRCSQNIFVIVFVFVFLLVRSCFLTTLIKCLNGQKSQKSLFEGVLITLIKCLNCQKSHRSLFGGVLKIYLSLSLSLSFCWSGHVSSPL